ncbi:MAG TPA: aspartate--tRNA ligase [Solirubrobacteraceae bacterium]|nr:aspartate--tRNA ligase [Solirubrobacteraceae bacterium]
MKQSPRPNAYRDHWAGELSAADVGTPVRLAGWVNTRRDHGGVVFVDLRDRSGLLQLVFHPDTAPAAHAAAHHLRPEHVISVTGDVVRRAPENVNPALPTGEIELAVTSLDHLAASQTPPFPLDDDGPLDETLRLRHRYLDLRRDVMRTSLELRHTLIAAMRTHLDARDFLEIETPILTRSTPEGARDFLVPARMAPGSFYALPQSPQLFKQLLMIAGYERYFQIARCFRDEDLRADRQLEFTQLDIELSFVSEDDILELIEDLMTDVFAVGHFEIPPAPWPRLLYDDAMLRFGSDKPDTRFGLEISDLTDVVRGSQFKVFERVIESGGVVRALNAGPRDLSRAEQDALNPIVARHGARAVAPIYVSETGWRSNLEKFFSPDQIAAVNLALDAAPGDLLLFVADREPVAAAALGALRLEFAARFDLIPAGRHDILWVVDFPMFGYNETDHRWDALHHPFTAPAPAPGETELSFENPGLLRSRGYDLVVDGVELGGGSIRTHTPEIQSQVFAAIGMDEDEAEARFGFLLEALRYGAPPHGGIAFGIDRIVAIIAGHDSIREVIPFPKTASGSDPLTGAPAPVDDKQLRELGIRLAAPVAGQSAPARPVG